MRFQTSFCVFLLIIVNFAFCCSVNGADQTQDGIANVIQSIRAGNKTVDEINGLITNLGGGYDDNSLEANVIECIENDLKMLIKKDGLDLDTEVTMTLRNFLYEDQGSGLVKIINKSEEYRKEIFSIDREISSYESRIAQFYTLVKSLIAVCRELNHHSEYLFPDLTIPESSKPNGEMEELDHNLTELAKDYNDYKEDQTFKKTDNKAYKKTVEEILTKLDILSEKYAACFKPLIDEVQMESSLQAASIRELKKKIDDQLKE